VIPPVTAKNNETRTTPGICPEQLASRRVCQRAFSHRIVVEGRFYVGGKPVMRLYEELLIVHIYRALASVTPLTGCPARAQRQHHGIENATNVCVLRGNPA